MVAIFEQYLKVASLKSTAERIQKEQFRQVDDGSIGAKVPDIEGENEDTSETEDEEVNKAINMKGAYDRNSTMS